ncbi:hypothetical protein C900_02406 [Fulvivirga imtechensis AK7]|uniref:Uncharacterized protein n=1 Tax=Fulvivirga imtechensis AK7 TaxID=1237149 RepID=L8JS28_9BACT|nr:hypothetical protein C900_02406 [Fulvivirga imtechensis AK7]
MLFRTGPSVYSFDFSGPQLFCLIRIGAFLETLIKKAGSMSRLQT